MIMILKRVGIMNNKCWRIYVFIYVLLCQNICCDKFSIFVSFELLEIEFVMCVVRQWIRVVVLVIEGDGVDVFELLWYLEDFGVQYVV